MSKIDPILLARISAACYNLFMTSHQAARLRALINSMARQLDNETDPAKRLELKRGIRAAEVTLTEN